MWFFPYDSFPLDSFCGFIYEIWLTVVWGHVQFHGKMFPHVITSLKCFWFPLKSSVLKSLPPPRSNLSQGSPLQGYYGIRSDMSTETMLNIAAENLQTMELHLQDEERRSKLHQSFHIWISRWELAGQFVAHNNCASLHRTVVGYFSYNSKSDQEQFQCSSCFPHSWRSSAWHLDDIIWMKRHA